VQGSTALLMCSLYAGCPLMTNAAARSLAAGAGTGVYTYATDNDAVYRPSLCAPLLSRALSDNRSSQTVSPAPPGGHIPESSLVFDAGL